MIEEQHVLVAGGAAVHMDCHVCTAGSALEYSVLLAMVKGPRNYPAPIAGMCASAVEADWSREPLNAQFASPLERSIKGPFLQPLRAF